MLYAEKMALIAGLCIVLYAYLRYWQRTRDTRGLLMFWRREMTPVSYTHLTLPTICSV